MASLESLASRLVLATTLATGCNYQATQPRIDVQPSESKAESSAPGTDRAHTLCYECRDKVLGLDGDIASVLEGIAKAASCIDELNKDPNSVECKLSDAITIPASKVTECEAIAKDNIVENVNCLSGESSKVDPHAVEDRFLAKSHVCERKEASVLSYIQNTCVPEVKNKKTLLTQLHATFERLNSYYLRLQTSARLRNESTKKARVDADQQTKMEAERKAKEDEAKKKQILDDAEDALKD